MAVEMHGVGNGRVVLDEPERPYVCCRNRDDVRVAWHRPDVAILDVLERGVVPVDLHGRVVHRPEHASDGVVDIDLGIESVSWDRREACDRCRLCNNGGVVAQIGAAAVWRH